MKSFILHKFHILKFFSWCEGWRSYTRHDNGKWVRVKLPRGRWQHTFCADPFLFRYKDENYVFFETMTRKGKGILGCSKEVNGKWIWQGIALEEPWHLSYPQVFAEGGKVYMIPESCKREPGAVCIYEAVEFPLKWNRMQCLIDKPFADCTIVKRDGHWYMACYDRPPGEHAELWHAEHLLGPWLRHPMWDKITQTRQLMRCGGRFIEQNGKLHRVAQDCDGFYGIRLWKVPIEEISPDEYREGMAEILMDIGDSPNGMKHTWNEITVAGERTCVIDVHHDGFRPFCEILSRICVAIMRKFGF